MTQLALGVMMVSIAVASVFNNQQEEGKIKPKPIVSTSLDSGKSARIKEKLPRILNYFQLQGIK